MSADHPPLEGETTSELARELLASARGDAPSASARAAAAQRLAAIQPGAGWLAGQWIAGTWVAVTWIAVVAAAGAGGGVVAMMARGDDEPTASIAKEAAPQTADLPPVVDALPRMAEVHASPSTVRSVPRTPNVEPARKRTTVAGKRRAPTPPPTPTSNPTPNPTPATDPTIDDELAALDSARSALAAGAHARALAMLDQHDTAFPRGVLRPEAAVLRIEVHLAAGDFARAAERAEEFLAANPRSALAARVRSLLSAARSGGDAAP